MNNRELKFRIWDSHKKEFLPYSCMVNHLDTDEFYCFDRWFKMSEEGCILQQWTGLLDKNKNPIYEGDIVKWHEGENNLSEVIFQNGSFMVRGINWGAFWYLSDYCDFYKIIGNIFETPELLKTNE